MNTLFEFLETYSSPGVSLSEKLSSGVIEKVNISKDKRTVSLTVRL